MTDKSTEEFTIRAADASDPAEARAMRALLPRLADFEIPSHRNPDHLWQGDEALLLDWFAGNAPMCFAHVAEAADDTIIGLTLVSMRPELLSHEPSAHLEAIVVAATSEGRGIGRALLAAAENEARQRGALSMTLHVFAGNTRARTVYEGTGYQGELIRHIKLLD